MYISSAIRSVTLRVSRSLATSKRMTSRGKPGVDEVEKVADPLVVDLLLEERGELLAHAPWVLQGIAEVLGERAFAEPKKPDTQTPMLSLGSDGASAMALSSWAYWSRMLSVATYSVISA